MNLPPLMQTTPGITSPKFSAEPLMTEGEATPGPDDVNPFEQEQELRERIEFERNRKSQPSDELLRTVPQPERVNTPRSTIQGSEEKNDPFVFGAETTEPLQLFARERQTDIDLRFETGELFQF